MPAVEQYAQSNGISGSGENLLKESSIRDLFQEELSVYGKDFKSFELPQNFDLLAEEWSIDNGFLTPTLKLKREIVEQKFKGKIESLYSE
jgi:long-chain acyl-CoA synthetase